MGWPRTGRCRPARKRIRFRAKKVRLRARRIRFRVKRVRLRAKKVRLRAKRIRFRARRHFQKLKFLAKNSVQNRPFFRMYNIHSNFRFGGSENSNVHTFGF